MDELQNAFAEPVREKRHYEPSDALFALLFLVLGYFLSRFVFLIRFTAGFIGLGALVLVLAVAGMSLVYLRLKGRRLTGRHLLHLGVILLFSAGLFLFENPLIKFLLLTYVMLSFLHWYFCAAGNRQEDAFGDMLPFDMLKSVLVIPFGAFGTLFGACTRVLTGSSVGKKILLALGGTAIAIIPTAIVFRLLISADGAFQNLTDTLFSDLIADAPLHIFCFFFGIPAAMYLFGMLYGGVALPREDILTKEQYNDTRRTLRFVPALFTCAAVTPVLLVYVLFFVSQTSYFLSAFAGIRPADITYADYARRGFFELCAVAIINLIILVLAEILTRRNGEKRSPAVRVYGITLSVCTLALIAIALSKMVMYIDAYGLTLLRVYTTWFMVLLALLFVLLLLRHIFPRLPFWRTLTVGFAVLFAVLVFGDADATVARYNVWRYQSGTLDTVDIQMMYDLSDSAVEYVIPLAEDPNPRIARDAADFLDFKARQFAEEKMTFADFNLTTYRARQALAEWQK